MKTPELAGGSPRNDETVLVRGITHLLAVVPHLIGYLPGRSLVVVATRIESTRSGVHRGGVVFAARVDLPPPAHVQQLTQVLGEPLRRLAGEGGQLMLHVFGYDLPTGPDGEVDAGYVQALLQALETTALWAGTELHDVDLVREAGRQHRRLLVATRRTHEQWQPVPDAADVPAAAEFVLQGRAPLASREEVAAAVRRRDEEAAARTDLALTLLAADRAKLDPDAALRALGAWVVHGAPSPTARERAWIIAELHDRQVRDALLGRWLPQMFEVQDILGSREAALFCRRVPPWPREAPDAALDRLLELAAKVPFELGAPVLTVAAFLAWGRGQGTVANEACDLALEVDPDYRMAVLLRECLEHGVKPPRAAANRQGRRARRRGPGTAA
ncbi:DUF4192 domain-containing protein [Ornithinimicrobium sufpigmenti]|uniref:DUF4192 domain-containing protein n=1 Tax=Ornithinimicrobium sufpigmenti TaxID=2508882 RepID=UPI001035969A|nr:MULTISPECIES: DUF4192 domain-containing protein [unclassified Ornithinimicrobium]